MQNDRCACGGAGGCENRSAAGLRFRRFRRALLPLAAAAALLFAGGPAARAQSITPPDKCAADGTTVTCTGDLSGGVDVDGGGGTYTGLNIHGLTGDIAPAGGTEGIKFSSGGNVSLNVDTGGFDIVTQGTRSEGILAQSSGNGSITIDMTGNIVTKGEESEGIDAKGDGSGAVTITVTGNIETENDDSQGIEAFSDSGAIKIDVTGDIATKGERSKGIDAANRNGAAVEVILAGSIETEGTDSEGIYVDNNGSEVTKVTVTGDITTTGDDSEGIDAVSDGDGAVEIAVQGNIRTDGVNSQGIEAYSSSGAVKVDVTGNIATVGNDSDGINAVSDGDGAVEVIVTGNIRTEGVNSRGIYAKSNGGDIRIALHGGTIASEQSAGIEFDDGATNSLTIRGTVTIRGGEYISEFGVEELVDVRGGSGDETIDNYGRLTTPGRIDLGEGVNVFNNRAGATFNSGTSVILAHDTSNILDDTFANAGDLSPGGAGEVQTTTLAGVFQNFITDENGIAKKGTFTVTIGPDGTADLLQVAGVAFLGGTVRVVGAYELTEAVPILWAIAGLEGPSLSDPAEFDEIVGSSLFYDLSLSYSDSNNDGTNDTVTLSSAEKPGVTFRGFAATANQRAVAGALDSLPADNAIVKNGKAATAQAELRAAYDGLSGELHASLKGALMDGGRATAAAVNRRLAARAGGPGARLPAAAAGPSRSPRPGGARGGFWIEGYGGRSVTGAASGAARMTADRRGAVFGVDRALGGGWRLGALGGYGRTELRQRARRSSGSVDSWSVGLYGGLESGASRFGFGALYTGHTVDVRRSVRIGDVSQRLSAGYDARSWQVFAEAGHRIQAGGLTLEPFAGVSHTGLYTEGFRESGGGAALTASSDTDAMTFATLGLRASMPLDDGVRLRGMAGWRHAFGDTAPSSAHSMAGGARFAVAGAPVAQDALDIELGIEAGLADTATFGAAYTGRYGGGAGHGLTAELRLAF